jgi:ceramide glucosyltransferase
MTFFRPLGENLLHMSTLLAGATFALLVFTLWRHATVLRFFRAHSPAAPLAARGARPRLAPELVSILQPILSGDPTLPVTLGYNVRTPAYYRREFLWLVEDDVAGRQICGDLIAAHPDVTIRLLLQGIPPQGVNPKTFKLINGLAAAQGDIICVLDDDTMLTLPPAPRGGQDGQSSGTPAACSGDPLCACLPYLYAPGAGLAFGLPYQVNFRNLWSALIALFVNANSLPTYISYASLHKPVTINGMFYALRRTTLLAAGGFSGLEHTLADDFAVAQRIRSLGPEALHLVQTPLRHAISTDVPTARRYLSLMQRWFIFPRESLLRHLPLPELGLLYGLILLPTLLPPLLVLGAVIWPSPLLWGLLGCWFALSYGLFLQLNAAYLYHATPLRWSLLLPLMQLLFPLQLLAALLLPQRITWRGHTMAVMRGGGFRYINRRPPAA